MRWALVAIAFCACKSDRHAKPEATGTTSANPPDGARRYPEVDAAIDAMRPALLLAEPTEEVSACKGPLEVFPIDQEAALLIAGGRAAGAGSRFTVPSEIDAVVRYASKSTLSSADITAIRTWASARPRDGVWGFLERSPFVERGYEGVLHVIDPKTRVVLCHTPITAPSLEGVAAALSEKLATLRAGKDVVTLPDPATDNRGPALDRGQIAETETWHCSRSTSDRKSTRCYRETADCARFYEDNEPLGYSRCGTQSTAVCFTYRDLVAEKDAYGCHTTMESCLHKRRVTKEDRDHPATAISRCTELGTSAATP